jgi:multidrug efflux pump subunit AcrA (membrane-fusion protein)
MGRFLNISSVFVVAAALLTSCGGSGGTEVNVRTTAGGRDEAPQGAPVAVTVAKSETRRVASTTRATGTLVADETSDIAPKTAGKVANVAVNVGQFVGAGSVVATIDDRDARAQLASAQAGVNQAIAGVRQAEARLGLSENGRFEASAIPEVRAANANYLQAVAEMKQAEANEKRYRELTESGDIALATYETYRTARDTARARANNAKELLNAAANTARQNNAAIQSAKAAVEAARTQVADAQRAIADAVIRAPFSGFISSRPVAVGEYVSSASVVATIIRSNPIKVEIQVAEADVPGISIGQGVSIAVDAYKDRRFAGTVSAINPSVDPSSRAAIVEGRIENGDNSLRTGMFATVNINKEGGAVSVFVPKAAVYNDQATQSYRVFTVHDGVAKLHVVQLGTDEGDFVQILSGLEGDQTVATSNLDQLYEGAKVAV